MGDCHSPGRSNVLHERAEVEAVKVSCELEVDVERLAALERRVDRLDHPPVLVARDLPRGAKAERSRQRMALVTDKDWVRHGASAFGWLAPGELRLFGLSESQEARAWLSEASSV
jgi:SpoIIAA-like